MNKLRLRLSGSREDFARLYNFKEGFHGLEEAISFPSDESLCLFLISAIEYDFSVEGDAQLERYDDVADEHYQMYDLHWSTEARALGAGRATVKLVHPKFPDQPSCFRLSIGEFSHQVQTLEEQIYDANGSCEASKISEHCFAALVMLTQEQMHAACSSLSGACDPDAWFNSMDDCTQSIVVKGAAPVADDSLVFHDEFESCSSFRTPPPFVMPRG